MSKLITKETIQELDSAKRLKGDLLIQATSLDDFFQKAKPYHFTDFLSENSVSLVKHSDNFYDKSVVYKLSVRFIVPTFGDLLNKPNAFDVYWRNPIDIKTRFDIVEIFKLCTVPNPVSTAHFFENNSVQQAKSLLQHVALEVQKEFRSVEFKEFLMEDSPKRWNFCIRVYKNSPYINERVDQIIAQYKS